MAEGGGGGEPPDPGAVKKIKMAETDGGNKSPNDDGKMDVQATREKYLYTKNDQGPYRVYVELTDKTNRINKFTVGAWLRKSDKYRRSVIEMKYLGRNKIIVFMSYMTAANAMVDDEGLKQAGYSAYVPRHLVCISGVLAGIPTDIPEAEILCDIESPVPVMSVYRLSRFVDGAKQPSNRVSVTFRAKTLPEKIRLFGSSCKVNPFIRKVEFCTKCHRFNHKANNCKGRERCDKCARIHSPEDEQYRNCNEEVKCFHCRSSSHPTTDPNCPERMRQASINAMMAKKCITYVEARELVAPVPVHNSYDLLANYAEFPVIRESYAKMTAGRQTKRTNTPPEENMMTEKPTASNGATGGEQTENGMGKRMRYDRKPNVTRPPRTTEKPEKTINGTGLNNTEAVTEKEKWETAIAEACKKTEENANRNAMSNALSFYTALMQIPEITEFGREKIKDISKHFLKIDDFIN